MARFLDTALDQGDGAEEAGAVWGGDAEDCGRGAKRRLEHEGREKCEKHERVSRLSRHFVGFVIQTPPYGLGSILCWRAIARQCDATRANTRLRPEGLKPEGFAPTTINRRKT